jgi:hypothetical protein
VSEVGLRTIEADADMGERKHRQVLVQQQHKILGMNTLSVRRWDCATHAKARTLPTWGALAADHSIKLQC